MSNNSSSIAVSNILTPLADNVERERRLIEAGKSFDQRNKETIERDRDGLRRSGILADDWTPNETNADHGYWNTWSGRLLKVANELEAAGETAIAGQVLTFYSQIDARDEVTCESDFRFEKLAEWLAAVMAGDRQDVSNTKPKRRGRKKADYKTVELEAQLAAEWDRARDDGIYKADFARDKGMNIKDLDRLLKRVASRKKHIQ